METTTKTQLLIKAIHVELENAYEDTLQEVLELLKIRKQEDEEDERDFEEGLKDIAENGTISWEEIKKEMKKDVA
ncbi:hypothetical protein CAL7716_004960 [Calothrix sp. PCC 7716]|nr:hypothetical protein CAL7716_004960 [Calothrix sp. PCC 7716]